MYVAANRGASNIVDAHLKDLGVLSETFFPIKYNIKPPETLHT